MTVSGETVPGCRPGTASADGGDGIRSKSERARQGPEDTLSPLLKMSVGIMAGVPRGPAAPGLGTELLQDFGG